MRALIAFALVLVAALGIVLFFFMGSAVEDPGTAAGPTASAPQKTEPAPAPDLAPTRENIRETQESPEPAEEVEEIKDASVGNSLIGYVYDDEGEPLPGAVVAISRDPFMGEALSMQWFLGKEPTGKKETTRTDSQGKYTFKSIAPATDYFMMVDHDTFRPAQDDLVFVGESGEFTGPEFRMKPGASLAGYVTDVGNNPVPDAVLHLDSAYMMGIEQRSPDRMTISADHDGYFEFKNVGQGARNLMVLAQGYGMQVRHNFQFEGTPGEKLEHTFLLEPGQPIAGRIFGPENEPVVGAHIMAMKYTNQVSSRGEAVTNENGEFMIEDLSQGSYNLMIESKGYRVARHNRVQVGDVNVQIEMIRQACISGKVVTVDGTPVKDFTAVLLRSSPAGTGPNAESFYENTDVKEKIQGSADGSYTLCGLNPGTFVVKVKAKGLAPTLSEPFSVSEGQPVPDIPVRLSEGGEIRGRLVDSEGAPISGARVSTHDDEHGGSNIDPFLGGLIDTSTTQRKTKSDAEGYFDLKLLNAGRYKIKVEHNRFTTHMQPGIVVANGGTAEIGSITLQSGGIVKGKLFDSSGGAVHRGEVRLWRTDHDETFTYQVRTNQDGSYNFPHVKPGSYKLSASRPAGAAGSGFETILDQQSSEVLINVVQGTTITRELRLGN